MTVFYEVPLQPTNQTVSVSISGSSYSFRTYYCNEENSGWVLDISDSSGNPVIQGIPLVTGADLLGQFAYLNLGFSLMVTTDSAPAAVPTFENLGINGRLYVVTNDQ
ncbi:phage baseplate plug protein [Acetobacter sp. DsW_059]|uniref:phage baseplate plug family protein n=1 Tax=Acetobacter sp. DsW_059 TaxID=1670661 RepID=UPI000A393E46|nr:hypothetical protein HK25_13255 [Acetobacter sp. DsW_059]